MSSRECPTCAYDYDSGDHRVRILYCGHSECTQCMRAQFSNSRITCSTCRTTHVYANFNSIPVCYIAENLLGESNAAIMTPKLNKGICEEHAAFKLFWCNTHNQWICTHCSVTEHPRGDCAIVPIRKQLENDKDVMKANVSEELQHLNNTESEVKCLRDELDKQTEEETKQINKMKEEADKLKKSISQKEKDIAVIKVKKSKLNTLTQDFIQKKSELANLVTRVCDVNNFKELNLEKEKSAAIINRFENWRQELDENVAITIPQVDMMLAQIQSGPCVVMALSYNGSNIGHLQILLNGPPRYVQQFRELASGNSHHGSYCKANFTQVYDKGQHGERVICEDYINASGNKVRTALYPLEGGPATSPFTEGTVYVIDKTAGFAICTRTNNNNKREMMWTAIGHATSGLSELSAAIKKYDVRNIVISEYASSTGN